MKKTVYYLLGLCLMVCGCEKDNVVSSPKPTVLTATSSQAAPSSRVSIDEETATSCTWSAKDTISVYTSSGSFKPFALTSGAGEKTGKFEATLAADETVSDYAVYPAGNHSFSGGTLTVNLPKTYNYIQGVSNIPMVATVEDANTLKFKHCGGVIRFGVKGVNGKGSFVFHSYTHRVTGDFDVNFTDGVPQIDAEEGETEEESSVTINFEIQNSDETAVSYFYIPVPAGVYSKFRVEILDQDGTFLLGKTAGEKNPNMNNVVTRGGVLKMKTFSSPTFSGGNE